VSENTNAEVLSRILGKLPSVPWASRFDPSTMTSEWIYMSPQMTALFGSSEAELRRNPLAMMERVHPDDAGELQHLIMTAMMAQTPMSWTGRVRHAGDELRWIELRAIYERDVDGTILSYGQAFDVTERKRSEELHRAVIDALPAAVIVMTPDGKFPIYNRTASRYVGRELKEHPPEGHGVFKTDGVTLFPDDELPLFRVLAGEERVEETMIFRNAELEGTCWMHGVGAPIRDEAGKIIAAMLVMHDVTAQRTLEQELRTSNEQLAASEESKLSLIERLRRAVDELSTPILEVWDDVLAMPVIGVIDSHRTADMVQRLLAEVARTQASFVIVDLTGVEIVDTKTADHLIKLIRKVEIVGARCVLTGIRPAVSETLVDIGVDFGRITTLRNLKHGLREALRHARREREGTRDRSPADETSEAPRVVDGERQRPQ
jgi:rsbT co-antagonist protein RsbR